MVGKYLLPLFKTSLSALRESYTAIENDGLGFGETLEQIFVLDNW